MLKKVDIVTSDGQLNVDVAVSKMPPGLDRNDSRKLLESCKTKTGKDGLNTVFEIFKSYFAGTKYHVKLDFTNILVY
uniref:Odorant binding protein n=1 Tax=Athetis dissimilis TaxID=1737331 RepID=A0A4D6Q6U6_ATHDI|nr:odorant binding protein [Athetis dissimilis]